MKTILNCIIFTTIAVMASATLATDNRAVEVAIFGTGPAVDLAAFDTVKQVVGHAVATGLVDNFTVKAYGIEGGFLACAQVAPHSKTLLPLVKQLRTIKPNPITTAYSVKTVPGCDDETTVCTEEAKLCPDGKTYVGRTGPNCEFASCPGE